jgi:hypothetical protein
MKAGTAPGYERIYPEFLKNLGLKVCTWLSNFSRITVVSVIPKIWRRSK